MKHYKALLGLSRKVVGELYNRLPCICGVMQRSDKSLSHEAVKENLGK